jgi:anti-sigma regulatory factor (Ser/Thr protein kinase)/CheY-like chemotaxis protein
MTHELRTPLIGVLGMNGLLQRTPLSEQQRTLVDTVDKSGNDLLALISDVLDIARIEAGVLELEVDEIEPARIVEEVVELLAPQAQEKGVDLLTDIPLAALCSARGDRARIWQIIMNLIGNAIKFTPSGAVTVGLQLVAEGQGPGRFVFRVEDTGVGMDEATSQRVFDLFFQHNGLSSEARSGSGLGLPIVKQLVDLMGGRISVASRPAQGSCFTVELSLPLRKKKQTAAMTDLSGTQVVVAVAASASAIVLKRQLTELGADVIHPHSAAECLKLLMDLQRQGAACPLLLLCHDWYLQLGGRGVDVQLKELTRQLVLVCRDSAVNIPAIEHVLSLYQPFTWRRLFELLSRVQAQEQMLPSKSLGLIQPLLQPVADIDTNNQCRAPRVIYVGHHAAERQLLLLTLAAWQIVPDYVDTLHDAVALCQRADVVLMILDAAEVTAQSLNELQILKDQLPPCYLVGEHEPADLLAEPVTGYLKKPVSKAALRQILDPLLAKTPADSSAVVEETI